MKRSMAQWGFLSLMTASALGWAQPAAEPHTPLPDGAGPPLQIKLLENLPAEPRALAVAGTTLFFAGGGKGLCLGDTLYGYSFVERKVTELAKRPCLRQLLVKEDALIVHFADAEGLPHWEEWKGVMHRPLSPEVLDLHRSRVLGAFDANGLLESHQITGYWAGADSKGMVVLTTAKVGSDLYLFWDDLPAGLKAAVQGDPVLTDEIAAVTWKEEGTVTHVLVRDDSFLLGIQGPRRAKIVVIDRKSRKATGTYGANRSLAKSWLNAPADQWAVSQLLSLGQSDGGFLVFDGTRNVGEARTVSSFEEKTNEFHRALFPTFWVQTAIAYANGYLVGSRNTILYYGEKNPFPADLVAADKVGANPTPTLAALHPTPMPPNVFAGTEPPTEPETKPETPVASNTQPPESQPQQPQPVTQPEKPVASNPPLPQPPPPGIIPPEPGAPQGAPTEENKTPAEDKKIVAEKPASSATPPDPGRPRLGYVVPDHCGKFRLKKTGVQIDVTASVDAGPVPVVKLARVKDVACLDDSLAVIADRAFFEDEWLKKVEKPEDFEKQQINGFTGKALVITLKRLTIHAPPEGALRNVAAEPGKAQFRFWARDTTVDGSSSFITTYTLVAPSDGGASRREAYQPLPPL